MMPNLESIEVVDWVLFIRSKAQRQRAPPLGTRHEDEEHPVHDPNETLLRIGSPITLQAIDQRSQEHLIEAQLAGG